MLKHPILQWVNQAERQYYRLVHLGGSSETDLLQVYKTYFQGFAKVYPAIYNEEPVFCATGRTYRAISKPDVILLDVSSQKKSWSSP